MGADSVDLTARASGLLPFWLFFVLLAVWILSVLYAWRGRVSRPDRLPQILTIGSLIIANVLFFWRPLFTAAHLPRGGGDLNSFFFTLHAYSADRITSGEIPLWNPFLHGGMPQLGNFQAAVLYPPNLIAYVVAQPFSYSAIESLAILHYLIASFGAYLLLRGLGAGRIGAVAGGVLFAYGGFFVAHLGHYSMISAAAWVPWLFWAVHRLIDRRNWWSGALLALITFLTASGGHQQTLLFALAGAGVWWLFLTGQQSGLRIPGLGRHDPDADTNRNALLGLWTRSGAVSLAQFCLGVGSGLLLAAPMILPSLQLARRSVRSTLTIEQASEFSVQPVALLQLILPTVFGSNPTDYWGAYSSGEIWGYMGVTTLVVAAIGLALRPTAHRLFFAVLAVLALLYAVGPAAPVHGWFYQFLPGFDLIRAPARAYLFLNLAIAVLAGLAVSDLGQRVGWSGIHWRRVGDRALRFLGIALGATAFIIIPFFYTRILGMSDPPNRPVITVDSLWMMLIYLSLLAAVLWLWRRGSLRAAALGVALTAVMMLDLFSGTMPFNPTEEDLVASYREPELSQYLIEQFEPTDPFRIQVAHPGLFPNFGMVDGLHIGSGVYDPMQPSAYSTIYNVLGEQPSNPALDLLNLRYLITDANAEPPGGYDLAFESSAGNQVWERSGALPRAWFVSHAIDTAYGAQIDRLRDAEFDPAQQVLIERPPMIPDGDASGSAEIVSYEAERIVLSVNAEGPGYVVISEGEYPGWKAEVDGAPATIVSANYGIRAVPVDADSQQIDLRYEPTLVTFGTIAAGLGVLLVVGMLAGPFIVSRVPSEDERDHHEAT